MHSYAGGHTVMVWSPVTFQRFDRHQLNIGRTREL